MKGIRSNRGTKEGNAISWGTRNDISESSEIHIMRAIEADRTYATLGQVEIEAKWRTILLQNGDNTQNIGGRRDIGAIVHVKGS
jgi:hypothetical protein